MAHWIKRLVLVLLLVPAVILIALELLPGKWLARQISSLASASSGLDVVIDDASLTVFTLSPSLSLSGIDVDDSADQPVVDAEQLSATANLRALFNESPLIDRIQLKGGAASLSVDEQGRGNWTDWLPASDPASSGDDSDTTPAIPAVRSILIDSTQIAYRDQRTDLDVKLDLSAQGSTSDDSEPLTAEATGTINELPVSAQVSAQSLLAVASMQNDLSVDASATLGTTSADVQGVIGEPSSFSQLDLDFSVEGQDLQDIEAVSSMLMPLIPPFSLEGSLRRDNDEFILRRFDAVVGDSDLQGDIRVNPFSEPPLLYANIISTVLDLDDLAGLIGASPDPDEVAAPDEAAQTGQGQTDGRLLPDNPIPLTELGALFNGEIAFRSSEIRTELMPVESMDLQLQLLPDRLKIEPLTIGLAGGVVEGSLDARLSDEPISSTLELRVLHVDLGPVMASAGIDNDAFGQIGGRAKYWMTGDTVSEMAASADGGVFLLMTEGQVGALLTELAGIDLVESLTLLTTEKDELTDIRCAYADLHTREGLMSVQTFVIDTDDTVFLADGTVDFNDESLDLTIEPHPKDVSLLAAQTAVEIGGTLTDPAILPGKSLPLRVAASAILASVAGPAAALLPFLESGSGEGSPYCSGLASSLDEAR
ncbi:AsmA family protein [Granulosicoccus sp. 3-233]|uniref:AsmA family protein n=1 Tax=Granulosicoccus sp. 3-233 TaxID=3417969 RepID=UPI003D33D618